MVDNLFIYYTFCQCFREKAKTDMTVFFDYAPNFEEVDGAYWFGVVHASISPCMCASVCHAF